MNLFLSIMEKTTHFYFMIFMLLLLQVIIWLFISKRIYQKKEFLSAHPNSKPNKDKKTTYSQHSKTSFIMIDDNVNLTMAWEMAAENAGIDLNTYHSPQAFMKAARQINKNVNIYIDINLSNEIDGITLSKWAHNQGFKNLYLITGHDPSEIKKIHWVKGIFDKMPPFC